MNEGKGNGRGQGAMVEPGLSNRRQDSRRDKGPGRPQGASDHPAGATMSARASGQGDRKGSPLLYNGAD